jgi:aspartyl-tRNA synthetase
MSSRSDTSDTGSPEHPGNDTPNQPTTLRTHLCGVLRPHDAGSTVTLCGWVAHRREHGEHLAFIDLRDHSGIVQCVIDGSVDVRTEWVIAVTGTVQTRPQGMENPALETGDIEIHDCTVEVLNEAEPPPFPVDDRAEADEPVRLRYRYVDLRRPRMQRNLRLRSRVNTAIRAAMIRQGFVEIETPLLWAPTPEGSREFSVPARLHHGNFYALPQSPQLAKQLLMVGGIDRYFQIARCLRDEDLRADRQFEFMQLDMECSFATQDDVMVYVSEAVLDAAGAATGDRPPPIERITHAEALDRFGTDKPDLRFGMELIDLSAIFAHTEVKAFSSPTTKAIVVPDGATSTRARLDALTDLAKKSGAAGLAWFKVLESGGPGPGPGLEGPLARHLSETEAAGVIARTDAQPGDLVLCVSDQHHTACTVLGSLRTHIGAPPVGQGPHRYVWVVDFPMFEGIGADGNPQPAHHPFTMPYAEDLPLLETNPLEVRSQAYDLVLNGWELGSGSVRIHSRQIQERVFAALGIDADEAERRFGFLLGAFRYGAPPHAGFAFGVDRLVAILAGEENIREVIAYPKTQSGADLLTGAPAPLPAASLAELGIRVVVPPGGAAGPGGGGPASGALPPAAAPTTGGDMANPSPS